MPYLTTRKKLKLQLSPGLVASYDIQPGNGVGLFWDTTHTRDPHGGSAKAEKNELCQQLISKKTVTAEEYQMLNS